MVAARIAARSAVRMRRSLGKNVDGIEDEQPASHMVSQDTYANDTEDKQPAAALG